MDNGRHYISKCSCTVIGVLPSVTLSWAEIGASRQTVSVLHKSAVIDLPVPVEGRFQSDRVKCENSSQPSNQTSPN